MLDFSRTVNPDVGLAETSQLLPPEHPVDPLWRTLVRLRDPRPGPRARTEHESPNSLTPFVVGAYGHSRADAFSRGVGEAVERFALIDDGTDALGAARTGTWADLAADGAVDVTLHSLGDPASRDATLPWLAARWEDGASCWVPAALVDYPHEADHPAWFDSGPSGAASGPGRDAATRSALLEIIERDAFMTAWDCGIALTTLDPVAVRDVAGGSPRHRGAARGLTSVLRIYDQLGLQARLALLPTVEGVACIAGFAVDPSRGETPIVTVGCNADESVTIAALGALQEALQLRSLVYNLGRSDADAPEPSGAVVSEDDRLNHLASPAGARQILEWANTFVPGDVPTTSAAAPRLDDAVRADGCRLIHVDLTPRLPAPLRSQGWAAVKLLPVGYQPLRMDERFTWSWDAGRRETAVRRARSLGLEVARPDGGGPPHPLP